MFVCCFPRCIRAFDHMCGYLNRLNPEIHGLVGNETNPMNVSDPNSPKIQVNPYAPYVDPDPSHSVPSTTEQVTSARLRGCLFCLLSVLPAERYLGDVRIIQRRTWMDLLWMQSRTMSTLLRRSWRLSTTHLCLSLAPWRWSTRFSTMYVCCCALYMCTASDNIVIVVARLSPWTY